MSSFDGGLAVSTPYRNRFGDRISLYVLGEEDGPFRLIDNALTISFLESEGVKFDNESRRILLLDLLSEYEAVLNEEFSEISMEQIKRDDLPSAIVGFSALLLRMNDFIFTNQDRVENTFKEDIKYELQQRLGTLVTIVEDLPVSNKLQEITPDLVFYPDERPPVAFFVATSEARLWQAIHLRLIAEFERHIPLVVVAMLQTDAVVGQKARAQADNRLDAIPRYDADPSGAIQRVVAEVMGRNSPLH